MQIDDEKNSNSYKFIEYLLKNPNKLIQNTDIAKTLGIKRNSLSYTASRMKDFILNGRVTEGVLKVVISGSGRSRVFFKCLKEVADVEAYTLRYLHAYKAFNLDYDKKRQGRKTSDKPTVKNQNLPAPAIPHPAQLLTPITGAGSPIDVPINISITVSVDFEKV